MRSFLSTSSAMILLMAADLGCVSRAEHASTQRALDDATATLTSTQASLDAAKRTIAARDAKTKELEQAITQAEARVADCSSASWPTSSSGSTRSRPRRRTPSAASPSW